MGVKELVAAVGQAVTFAEIKTRLQALVDEGIRLEAENRELRSRIHQLEEHLRGRSLWPTGS